MPLEPLRFLHAANVRLDQAIGGAAALGPTAASVALDAPRAAFDHLIAAALQERVDFVLFSGNTFTESEESLAARLTLFDGLGQLADESIGVFILPGPLDPADAWRRIPDLPENVSLIDKNAKAALAVRRGDVVIARIGSRSLLSRRRRSGSRARRQRAENKRPNSRCDMPFQIGVWTDGDGTDKVRALDEWSASQDKSACEPESSCGRASKCRAGKPVDYLALGGGRRQTIVQGRRMAHDPGPTQGNGPRETGPCGGTLVTVETDATIHCDFVPTGALRWERFEIDVCSGTDPGELLSRCRDVLAGFRPEPSENAWIFEWVLRGHRGALAPFDDDSSRRRLEQQLAEATVVPNAKGALHAIVLEPQVGASGRTPADDPLEADFLEALAGAPQLSNGELTECLDELRQIDASWAARIEALAAELRPGTAWAHADRLGRQLVRPSLAEGATG